MTNPTSGAQRAPKIPPITACLAIVPVIGLGAAAYAGGGDAPGTGPVITGAQIIAGPVAIAGDTSDNSDQFDVGPLTSPPTDCGASAAPDEWYTIAIGTTTGTINIDIDLCTTASGGGGTLYDSKIFVLDGTGNPLRCNNETGCTTPGSGPSAILNLHLVPGTYELAIDGFLDSSGVFEGEVRLFAPLDCFLDPTATECADCIPEGEICDPSVPDNFNGGCNSTPEAFSVSETWACGTLWADNGMRDTDWWSFSTSVQVAHRLEIWAEADTVAFLAEMSPGGVCPVIGIPSGDVAFSGDCDTIHTSSQQNDYVLDPGDYVVFVGAGNPDSSGVFDGFPCPDGVATNNAYVVRRAPVVLPPPPCPWNVDDVQDCDGIGNVGFSDILELISNWGLCPTADQPIAAGAHRRRSRTDSNASARKSDRRSLKPSPPTERNSDARTHEDGASSSHEGAAPILEVEHGLDLGENTTVVSGDTPAYETSVTFMRSPPPPCPWDLNGNGSVDFQDILFVFANWGRCPEDP